MRRDLQHIRVPFQARGSQQQKHSVETYFVRILVKMKVWFSGVTILLSLTIFLNTVSEIIPITSDSPLIGNLATVACAHFLPFVLRPVLHWQLQLHPSRPNLFYGEGTFFLQGSHAPELDSRQFLTVDMSSNPHKTWAFVDNFSLLGVAIMLSMTIFQSLIAETTPVSNSSPIIGIHPPWEHLKIMRNRFVPKKDQRLNLWGPHWQLKWRGGWGTWKSLLKSSKAINRGSMLVAQKFAHRAICYFACSTYIHW